MPKMFPLLFVFVQLTSACERRCANLNVKNVPYTSDLGPWVEAIDFHNNNVSAFNTTWLLMKFPHVRRINLRKNLLRCIPISTKVIILSDCEPTSKPTNPSSNHPSTRQLNTPKNSVTTTSVILTTSTVHSNDDGKSTTLILILLRRLSTRRCLQSSFSMENLATNTSEIPSDREVDLYCRETEL